MDFSIDAITDKFKNPTFLLLAVGVGGVGLYSLLSSSNQSTSSDDEEAQKTVIYQSEGGFTPEDIQNYTENSYYALAETFGTGLESLGNALIEAQQEGFSNIQQILSNSNVNDNAIIDDDTTDANSSSSTSSSSSSSSSSSTKKSTSSSTKKYFTVGTWGKDSIYETTLSGIAVKFKTTVSNLLKLNPSIKNPDLIYAGQKLRVA